MCAVRITWDQLLRFFVCVFATVSYFFLFFLVLFILNYYGPLILEVSKSI